MIETNQPSASTPRPQSRRRAQQRGKLLSVLLLVFALIAAACGGSDDDPSDASGDVTDAGNEEAGPPQYGGTLTYALEAETESYCLAEATLAIAGIQVARSMYDTLTEPDENGVPQPMLAESFEPNETYDQWTFKLREGITFHDGTALDSTVVKNNLDAYRGAYEARNPLLFRLLLADVESVEVIDELTFVINTSRPWVSLPALMHASGRLGIMAQAQLDSPECPTELIGTGPFKFEGEWTRNASLKVVRNENYWRVDKDGNQLPYLDAIEFKPMFDQNSRLTSLLASNNDVMLTHVTAGEIITELREEHEAGNINLWESNEFAEVSYGMLNTSKPPFDSLTARKAVAHSIDRDAFNDLINLGVLTNASGPFGPGSVGYLDDAGFPEYNPELAQQLVAQYKEETGNDLSFTLKSTNDSSVLASVQYLQELGAQAGIKIDIDPVDQATLITTAIGNDWQAMVFRNHPGGDPDLQYTWWHSTLPTNFSKFKDEEVDRLLDAGRETADPDARVEIYQDLNRRLNEQVYSLWFQWTQWDFGAKRNVHGILGPDLGGDHTNFPGLAIGHPVDGIWLSE